MSRKLASSSAIMFAMRLFGAGLMFLAQACIARFWGPGILGEYLLITATVNLIAVLMPLGFHTIGPYFTAEYRARGDGRQLRRFLFSAYGHVGVSLAVLLIAGQFCLAVFGEPGKVLEQHWLPACLLAVSAGLVHVNGSVLVGLKHAISGYAADALFRPMLVIGGTVLAIMTVGEPGAGFTEMLWIMSIGYFAVALIHFAYTLTRIAKVPSEVSARAAEHKRWWRFALPWVLGALATDFFFDIDLLLLSGHLSREELAIFGVCTRLFSLIAFGVTAVYAVTLPDMFESEANADRAGFTRKIGDANLVAALLSVGFFFVVSIGGPFALMLFGPDFLVGAAPLSVLCLALVVRSVFGPASLVLSIHDRPYASLPSIALGIGTLIVGNIVLVPMLGLMGAALAALLSFFVWNFALWLKAYRTAGIDVSIFPRLKNLIAQKAAQSGA